MIFMHKESGELFELMFKSAQDYSEFTDSGALCFRIGAVVLIGNTEPYCENFAYCFDFIGFI